jgi:hypothetical protein
MKNPLASRIRRKPARNEHCLQRSIANWCDGLGRRMVQARFAAIPNGGGRDIVTASRLKAEGVRAGMPDLVFWRDSGRVMWVEIKNGTSGQLSPSQKELHARMKADGHMVHVCRTLAEAIEVIQGFYHGPNNKTMQGASGAVGSGQAVETAHQVRHVGAQGRGTGPQLSQGAEKMGG